MVFGRKDHCTQEQTACRPLWGPIGKEVAAAWARDEELEYIIVGVQFMGPSR